MLQVLLKQLDLPKEIIEKWEKISEKLSLEEKKNLEFILGKALKNKFNIILQKNKKIQNLNKKMMQLFDDFSRSKIRNAYKEMEFDSTKNEKADLENKLNNI